MSSKFFMDRVSGQVVDVVAGRIFPGEVAFENGRIVSVRELREAPPVWILPGFVDAHVHIESSMLVPSEFARVAVRHGTVGTVSDPHEIANVLGLEGVRYMVDNGRTVPFHFYFGAPSCVPATTFETAGAKIDAEGITDLFRSKAASYLSEMMNYPGVIQRHPEVMEKIHIAHQFGKPIDGHAPEVRGTDLDAYISAGISTDHECVTLEEGREKIRKGMKVLIREGSAAKNFAALIPLLKESPDKVMFCTDDMPDGLEEGHINLLVSRAIGEGYSPLDAIRAVTLNPVRHYGLNTGLLQTGDPATFNVMSDLEKGQVIATYIDGRKVAENGLCLFEGPKVECINAFYCHPITINDLEIQAEKEWVRVIEAIDGELITKEGFYKPKIVEGKVVSDPDRDLLKLVVVNRYESVKPAVALIKNFGLKRGAIAESVAHDSHNVIAVGASDAELLLAINRVIESKGGIAVADGNSVDILELPIAGLMSDQESQWVSQKTKALGVKAKALGCQLKAPFVTLSFMALLVIPELKLSDLGLFDGRKFKFTSLFTSERYGA
jgi:adenine deaminase